MRFMSFLVVYMSKRISSAAAFLFLFLYHVTFEGETLGSGCHFLLVIEDGFCEHHEALVYVCVVFNRGVQVFDFMCVAPLLYFGIADSSFEVAFVAEEHDDCFVCFESAEVVPLFFDVFE